MKQIIKVIENTTLSQHFSSLERAAYEQNSTKFLIDFILLHPDLKQNYDFYWEKYIDKQIAYEKEKQSFSDYILKEFPNTKNWRVDFTKGIIEVQ